MLNHLIVVSQVITTEVDSDLVDDEEKSTAEGDGPAVVCTWISCILWRRLDLLMAEVSGDS